MGVGWDLTVSRLTDRGGLGQHVGVLGAAAILGLWLILLVGLWRGKGLYRVSAGCLFSATPYLFIPNLNIGSEHYWYLAVAGFLGLVLFALSRVRYRLALGLIYLTLLVSVTRTRVLDFVSSERLLAGQLRRHPEDPRNWAFFARTLADRKAPAREIAHYFTVALQMNPNDPVVLSEKVRYDYAKKNREGMRETIRILETSHFANHRLLGELYLYLGEFSVIEKDVRDVRASFKRAFELDPTSSHLKAEYERVRAYLKDAEG